MKNLMLNLFWGCLTILSGTPLAIGASNSDRADLFPEISSYLEERQGEFDSISPARKQHLNALSAYIRECVSKGQPAKLTFVCTHNSRRSHFAQIWAQIAATHYGVKHVEAYSGGTEATALNPRTIAALERAGVKMRITEASDSNPQYSITFGENEKPLVGFSKVFNMSPNPTSGFCAIMTCSHADEACPTVPGSDLRIAIPYEDPKSSDKTPGESATYDLRCAQIAMEMLYVMSNVQRAD